jgi:hypothetical protein
MEDFTRDISHRVLVQEDESIVLTGTIRDPFHDIEAQIVVDGASLEITAARVTFRAAPSPHCDQAQKCFAKLIGVVIGNGLTRSLNKALGGRDGCGNLRILLMGLLPLAINVKASGKICDEQEMLDSIHHQLRGTCVGYPANEKDLA